MSRLSSPANLLNAPADAAFADASGDGPEGTERLLSRTFLRGFEAGQRLSSREFDTMLPSLLDQFVAARAASGDVISARRWAETFLSFARRRSAARDKGGAI